MPGALKERWELLGRCRMPQPADYDGERESWAVIRAPLGLCQKPRQVDDVWERGRRSRIRGQGPICGPAAKVRERERPARFPEFRKTAGLRSMSDGG